MKRTISALLGISIAATMAVGLSGCGGKSDTITWISLGDKPDDHDTVMAEVNKIIEPELGLKLDIQYIDAASFTEKTKLKMASGEKYDIVYTGYVNDYQTAVSMGGLYDITDLMENIQMSDGTTVKMSDVIEDYYIESATVNGRVYGIPNIQVISNPPTIEMSKEVAEAANVDMEGLQEMAIHNTNYDTAVAYMDKITEELEKIQQSGTVTYAINPFNPVADNIYEAVLGGCNIKKDGSDSIIYKGYELPESQYGIDKLHEWYEKGYIRSDIASNNNATTAEEKAQYGMAWTTWKPGQDVYYKNSNNGKEPVYAFIAEPYVARKQALLTMLSVGANTQHPEEAVKLIYMLNSNKELFNLICWGIEGTHYTKNPDGTVKEIEGSGYQKIGQNAWRYGNQFNGFVMEGQPADVWEQTEKMNNEARKSPALGFVPNQDPINSEIANISNVDAEYKAKIQYGTVARAEYWDEYVDKMEKAGISKVQEELQKQYDEFLATK